jgi:hypothetical protein
MAGDREVETAPKDVAGFGPPRGIGMVGGQRLQIRARDQEQIGDPQPAIAAAAAEIGGGGRRTERFVRPDVAAALEQPDVDAGEAEVGDEAERLVVREQREREVGAREPDVGGGAGSRGLGGLVARGEAGWLGRTT